MKKRFARALFLFGTLFALWNGVNAQDPQYSQFYANKLLLNPAFTGSGIGYRVALNYRGQWASIPGYYKQTAVAFDMPLYVGSTTQGIGMYLENDVAGEGNLGRLNARLNYAYEIQLADERDGGHTLRIGLNGGIQQASIQMFKLRFPDQIDPQDGFVYNTLDPIYLQGATLSNLRVDAGAGLLYYNNYAFLSASVDHLPEPTQKFSDGSQAVGINYKLPRKYTVSGGMRIPLGDFRNPDALSITPAFLVKMQRQFFQVDLGTYVNLDPMVFGFWYRHQDAVVGLIGFRKDWFSIGYSYDYTISSLTNGVTGGSHEVSMVLEFAKDPKKRFKHRSLPCPKF
ncbi:MAG: type IX secretion system membrane protein PorP/SprF [Bacteroidia bacterium]|nr:type IX secretion system membrane protein PorP/SprF [Bacteroidia bacterium]